MIRSICWTMGASRQELSTGIPERPCRGVATSDKREAAAPATFATATGELDGPAPDDREGAGNSAEAPLAVKVSSFPDNGRRDRGADCWFLPTVAMLTRRILHDRILQRAILKEASRIGSSFRGTNPGGHA